MADPLSQPAAPAPSGLTSNLENPGGQRWLGPLTVGLCFGSVTIVVWMRMYVSLFIQRPFKWDDGLIFVSWLAMIAYSAILLETVKHGSFVDIWNLSAGDAMLWGQFANIEEIIYAPLMFATKLAVLVLYLRVFVPPRSQKSWVYYSILFIVAYNACYYVANLFTVIFNCVPREKIWNSSVEGTCVDTYDVLIVTAALNMASNFMMVLLPMTVIWRLRMSRKKKIEISVVFAFGVVAFAASLGDLIYSIFATSEKNPTVQFAEIALWTFGEITGCFMASCMPMIFPLVRHIMRSPDSGQTTVQISDDLPSRFKGEKGGRKTNGSTSFPSARGIHRMWSDAEEEPYLMQSIPFDFSDRDSDRVPVTYEGNHIMVSRTIDVQSHSRDDRADMPDFPKAYIGSPRDV